jgi:hypothetical protein
VKLVWLVSVPVIAFMALFAVKSAPTLAGPGCAAECAGVTADQSIIGVPTTTYASGGSIYQQVAGQYCSDKTGGVIYVASGAPSTGLTCPAASGSATAAATSTATSTATTAATTAATSTATRAATASATAGASGTATATATASH